MNPSTPIPTAPMATTSQPAELANPALDRVSNRLKRHKTTRLALAFLERCADTHLKDLVIDDMDDHRRALILGKMVYNFGSDSFLGLDRDERIQKAMVEALPKWGTHNGASRAFSSVSLCEEAERRLAKWLQVDDTLIFPSVTLANAAERYDTRAANAFREPDTAEPLRITATSAWKRIHHEIAAETFKQTAIGGAANCAACHGDAETGLFTPQKILIPVAAKEPS